MTGIDILIVEDERILAEDLELTLRDLGYSVAGRLSSGEKAVEWVSNNKVGLVLMDIHLEGAMDGIDAAGRISCQHDIPVIYLTAYEDAVLLERAKCSAAFGYLLKPFRMREIQAAIEIALYKHGAENQLKEKNLALEQALAEIQRLQGLLPICAACKKIRTPQGGWETVEAYIEFRSSARFSHTMCPECMRSHYPEFDIYDDEGNVIE